MVISNSRLTWGRATKRLIGLTLLLLLLCAIFLPAQLVPLAFATTRYVPSADYPTIQSAIDAAKRGDTIQVAAGTYYEHLVVDVALLELVGESKAATILDANGTGTPILLEASEVTVTGFTIRNGGMRNIGIRTNLHDEHTISDNIIENNVDGIYFIESNDNIITHNIFVNNHMRAINLGLSLNNFIGDNNISGSAYGINLTGANSTTVRRNHISGTSYAIYAGGTTQNTIDENTIQSSSCGIQTTYSDHMTISHNVVCGGMYGIQLHSTSDSELANNTITEASYGIYLVYSDSNTLGGTRGNLVADTDWGIVMYTSTANQIIDGNILGDNTWGMYLTAESSGNTIYHNNFFSNVRQVVQDIGCMNTWDDGLEGNYWDDYTGYPPASGVDYHPLMEPWPLRNIATTTVTVSDTLAYAGETVIINATVQNFGVITETVRLTTFFNSTPIATKTTTLNPGTDTTLTYTWNTTGIEPGPYIVSATAEPLPYIERNYTDNALTDGTVEITILLGDIDSDGTVDPVDLNLLMQAFGSTPASPNWNPNADLNKDDIVDVLDLHALGSNYGRTA